MAIYKASIGFPLDSGLPRDRVYITPHFFGDNPAGLANALKANLINFAQVANAYPFTISIYDAQKPPPSYPLATASNGTGNPATGVPRELALVLSYYSTYNRPSYRGRLYIPVGIIGGGVSLRPTATQITKALDWRALFTTNLPASHNWVVYSKKLNQSFGVTNAWVDDEWDIQRRRGLKGTTRQTVAVP